MKNATIAWENQTKSQKMEVLMHLEDNLRDMRIDEGHMEEEGIDLAKCLRGLVKYLEKQIEE